MANCLKHTVFRNSLYAIQVTQCTAFSLHNSYSVSGSESKTPMSIRIPSALIFMWWLFCWQCKCFKVEKTFLVVLRISSTTLLNLCSRRLEVVSQESMGAREGDTRRVFLSPRVSLSRAPILSCVHYFQAPATQITSAECERWLSPLHRLKRQLATTMTESRVCYSYYDEHCIMDMDPEANNRHLCTEASMMFPSC